MFLQPLLRWKRSKYYILCVCVYSLSYPACNVNAPYWHLWPARLYNIFPRYLTNSMIFGAEKKKKEKRKKKLLNTKCVFWFPLQFLSEKCLILRRNERYMIKKSCSLCVKYPLFLSDFNGTWNFLTVFWKTVKYQIPQKSVQRKPSCSMWTDGQTWHSY